MRERIADEIYATEFEYLNELYTLVCAKTEMERFLHKNEYADVDHLYKANESIYKKMISYCASSPSCSGYKVTAPDGATVGEASRGDSTVFISVDDKVASISKTFLGLSHTLNIYVKYSMGHQRAFEKVNKLASQEGFTELIKNVERMPGFKSAKITNFLIKPVQRICRYPLLLKELVKSTPPNHPTLVELKEALECMEQTLEEINEAQRGIEREHNLMRAQQQLLSLGLDLDVISPTRTLILDGPLRLVAAIRATTTKNIRKPKEGYYYLFDDFFLFIQKSKKSSISKRCFRNLWSYLTLIYMPTIFIPTDQALVTDPGENSIEIVHVSHQIWIFVLPSYHDKVFLMQKLEAIVEANLAEAKDNRNTVDKSKSALNIATLSRSGKLPTERKKKRDHLDLFAQHG